MAAEIAGRGLDNLQSQRAGQRWAGAACESGKCLLTAPAAAVGAWRLAGALRSAGTCRRSSRHQQKDSRLYRLLYKK